jgi:hypothetical protein
MQAPLELNIAWYIRNSAGLFDLLEVELCVIVALVQHASCCREVSNPLGSSTTLGRWMRLPHFDTWRDDNTATER